MRSRPIASTRSASARELQFQLGLIGPNGAGTTTCFNMITGVYKPTTGSIHLDGKQIDGAASYAINRMGVARTFQNIRLFKQLSVLTTSALPCNGEAHYGVFASVFRTREYRESEERIRSRTLELLAVFGFRGASSTTLAACLMVNSANWRSCARSRPIRSLLARRAGRRDESGRKAELDEADPSRS